MLIIHLYVIYNNYFSNFSEIYTVRPKDNLFAKLLHEMVDCSDFLRAKT